MLPPYINVRLQSTVVLSVRLALRIHSMLRTTVELGHIMILHKLLYKHRTITKFQQIKKNSTKCVTEHFKLFVLD